MLRIIFISISLLLSPSHALTQTYSEVIPIVRISPVYPSEALKNKQEGWVKIKFDITPQGTVDDPYVIESQPPKVFDRAAIEAIIKFKFKPRIVDGKAVTATATQTIEFNLPRNQSYQANEDLSAYQTKQLKFELKSHKQKGIYKNTLYVLEIKNNKLIKKIKLPDSKTDKGYFAQHPKNPFLFFYFSKNKKKGEIQIYDKKNLKLQHTLKTDAAIITPFEQQRFYFFAANHSKLLAYLGTKRKPTLYQIDGLSGKITGQLKLPKYTHLEREENTDYIWAQNYRNSKSGKKLKFINAHTMEVFRELDLVHKLVSDTYWRDSVQLIFDYKNEDPRYRVRSFNLTKNKFLKDFYSSSYPKIHYINDELFYIGNESGESKHLKIAKQRNNEMIDITNPDINIRLNAGDFYYYDGVLHLVVFAKQAVAKINMTDTTDYQLVKVPIDASGGLVYKPKDRVYLTEENDASVAMVDFKQNKFIAEQNTGDPGRKFGQLLASIAVTALTAPTGYAITPLHGFSRSNNKLFLNHAGTRLFAINLKTNDVTSFNADDLSDKHIVATGKGTFQIIQGSHEPNLPMVAIGMKKVTFMNAADGRMIKQIEYDKPIEISSNHELVYLKDENIFRVSLAYIND